LDHQQFIGDRNQPACIIEYNSAIILLLLNADLY